MLAAILALALSTQDEPLGWSCSAERAVEDRAYRLDRAIERGHEFFARLRISWMSNPVRTERFVEWNYGDPPLSDAPRLISFRIPATRRTSRATVRMVFPDGTGQSIVPTWETVLRRAGDSWSFDSLNPDLNRRLWAARNVRAVLEDRRHRVLGEIEMHFPESNEVMRLGAELALEVENKLADPSRPENRCSSYGEEVYADPV